MLRGCGMKTVLKRWNRSKWSILQKGNVELLIARSEAIHMASIVGGKYLKRRVFIPGNIYILNSYKLITIIDVSNCIFFN